MPGRILQQMTVAGAKNPVFMLDEIDKVGADWRGDPSSALLEVLDPEQNKDFSDHYLEVPYDLSQVLFITTANVVDTIIPPLRDRMEIIRLPGYTEDEKMHIAQQFLVPRQLREFGLTGQIGKVMEESARAAVSYARSRAPELGLKPGFFEDHFFHIHVPAGAIPKDGPSAGITMATAVVSVLTDRPVRREVAMTGEITLRGKVLPIGGLKEKLLAAHRAGIKTFILPEKNRKDLHEVPEEVKNSMELVLVKHGDEVLDKALLPPATRPSTPGLGFKRPLGGSQPGTVN